MSQQKLKARMSFKESRNAILTAMTTTSTAAIEEKVIKFKNDDVPRFLDALDKYENKSRRVRLVCK